MSGELTSIGPDLTKVTSPLIIFMGVGTEALTGERSALPPDHSVEEVSEVRIVLTKRGEFPSMATIIPSWRMAQAPTVVRGLTRENLKELLSVHIEAIDRQERALREPDLVALG